jgi:tight adherence protein B
MALVVFGFFLIMAASFGAVIALTRQTPQQQVVARRMALIHLSVSQQESAHADTAQLFKTIKKSRFRWLDEILGPYRFSQTAQILILQANSSTTVAGLILTSVGLFLGGYFVAWLFIKLVLVDIAGGVALCLLPYLIINFKRSRRVAAFNAGLAEAIDMLARALRAGHSVVSALEMLSDNAQAPVSTEFEEVFRQLNLGLPMRDALLRLLDRIPSADLRVLVTAILVQKDTGGNLAEILDRTVFVIRERLRIQGEIQVQTAQGRLTGWILSALPVVMMVLLNVVNPGYSSILFHDPLGRKLLYGSIAMLIAGSFIIRRIINAIEV